MILPRGRSSRFRRAGRRSRGGAATIAIAVAALVAVGTAGAVVAISRKDPEAPCSEDGLRARSIAEAALSSKISQMVAGNYSDLGTSERGVPVAGGSAWVGVENFDVRRELFRLTAQASFHRETQVVEAVLRPVVEHAPACAVFAGNASNDPDYVLTFSGGGDAADSVRGDVYSGSRIVVRGRAHVDGTLRARRGIDGAEGDSPVTRRTPDFGALLRGRKPSVHTRVLRVDALLEPSAPGTKTASEVDGRAPCDNPAHVFLKNPPDRAALTDTTPGDDYFLEDACADGRSDTPSSAGSSWIEVTGSDGPIGEHGAGATFVVDGDLWIASPSDRPVRFRSRGGAATTLSIVVRGSIHLGASVLDPKERRNAIALVALRREGIQASGDILIGGEELGTALEIDAFLFAERDIRRAEESRPEPILVRGTLIAGNHVRLGLESDHARLTVIGDERLADGTLATEGVPIPSDRVTAFTVLSWRALGPP